MTLSNSFYLRRLFFFVAFFISCHLFGDDVQNGEKLYKQNCTACHLMTEAKLVGPGLKGVTEKYEKEWLIKWIRNSQENLYTRVS